MLLRCPACGFSREVPEERIPAGTRRIRCPKCAETFELPATDSQEAPERSGSIAAAGDAEFAAQPTVAAEAAVRYAGFWIRFVASIIDSFLVTGLQLLLVLVFGFATGALMNLGGYGENQIAGAVGITGQLFALVFAIFYYVFLTGYNGQTLGKKVMGIRVTDLDGSSRVGYGQAFIREVPGKFISTVLLGIGYLMVAFTRNKQGLHDRIAGTLVIRVRRP